MRDSVRRAVMALLGMVVAYQSRRVRERGGERSEALHVDAIRARQTAERSVRRADAEVDRVRRTIDSYRRASDAQRRGH